MLRRKTNSYLTDDSSEDKKTKVTKKCVINRKPEFEDCKNCFEATQLESKMKYLDKNKIDGESLSHNVLQLQKAIALVFAFDLVNSGGKFLLSMFFPYI